MDDAICESCHSTCFLSGLKLSQLESIQHSHKHDPLSIDRVLQTMGCKLIVMIPPTLIIVAVWMILVMALTSMAQSVKAGRGVWSLCCIFKDTINVTHNFFFHLRIQCTAPGGERNHDDATVCNGLTCLSVQGVKKRSPGFLVWVHSTIKVCILATCCCDAIHKIFCMCLTKKIFDPHFDRG